MFQSPSAVLPRLVCALAIQLLLCGWVSLALAGQRVLLVRLGEAPTLVREATRFAYGELVAAGFEVTVARLSQDSAELPVAGVAWLSLDAVADGVRIRVVAPDGQTRFETSVVASDELSPDVIAVRAVEALRATLQRYAELQADADTTLQPPFAGANESAAPPAAHEASEGPSAKPPEAPLALKPAVEPVPAQNEALVGGGVGLSSLHRFDGSLPVVRLSGLWRRRNLGVGLELEVAPTDAVLAGDTGRVFVGRDAVSLRGQWFFPGERLSPFVFSGAGVAWYSVSAVAEQGFEANSAQHKSWVFSAGAGMQYQLAGDWSLAGELFLRVAEDGWTVRADAKELVTLDRPGVGAALTLWFSLL